MEAPESELHKLPKAIPQHGQELLHKVALVRAILGRENLEHQREASSGEPRFPALVD